MLAPADDEAAEQTMICLDSLSAIGRKMGVNNLSLANCCRRERKEAAPPNAMATRLFAWCPERGSNPHGYVTSYPQKATALKVMRVLGYLVHLKCNHA